MSEKETSTNKGLAGAAMAVLAGKGVAPRLLGYHNVYHGTTAPVAKSIKKSGFDPNKGGTGASSPTVNKRGVHSNPDFFERSKGKIHTTKHRSIATAYSQYAHHKHNAPAEVVKARVSHQHFKTMKGDPDMSPNASKNIAATTHHKIPAHQVVGGVGDKGIRGVVNKNTLRNYYKSSSGVSRAGRGALLLAASTKGAKTAYDAIKTKMEKKGLYEKAKDYLTE